MIIGATYSHIQTGYLGLDHKEIFPHLLDFGFDIIRIAAYWNEIEKSKGDFNYSMIKSMLMEFEKQNQNIVVTVGIKAPRWPEFYIPGWLENKTLEEIEPYVLMFIEKTVNELRDFRCIKYWQIENEPFDPSGPKNMTIPLGLLEKEVKLVHKLDNTRPNIITLWANELTKRNLLPLASPLSEVIGFDLYYKVPVNRFFYHGPKDSNNTLKNIISGSLKPVWITELQAEPWEKDKIIATDMHPKSISPQLLKRNFETALSLNPKAVFFWGFEYWYWKKKNGDDSM